MNISGETEKDQCGMCYEELNFLSGYRRKSVEGDQWWNSIVTFSNFCATFQC